MYNSKFNSSGNEFEALLLDILSAFAKKEWGIGAIKLSLERQDRFEGTDITLLGVPIDVTLAFSMKDKTRKMGFINKDGVTINYGVRFGNRKSDFRMPVLVLGAETATEITRSNMWVAIDTIRAHIKEILDIGMDKYFLATEA